MNTQSKFAVLFPGQGSQSPGMLSGLHAEYPAVGATFEEASDLLGYDLWDLCENGPEEKQRQTEYTQPLMYCSGVAIWRVWQSLTELRPVAIAGHSLGEYCALTAAGCVDFSEGVSLVRQRSQLMAAAVPQGEGGMAAVLGMDDQVLIDLCKSISDERIVEAANFNSPGQIAVSGHLDAIEKLVGVAREHGARKAVVLPVSVPNHSSLMHDAGLALVKLIDAIEWRSAKIPVMQNLQAQSAETVADMLDSLRQHVYSPVQWTQSVQQMISIHDVDLFVEMGPGKVLAGLGKRIDKKVAVKPVDSPETLQEVIEQLKPTAEMA